MYERRVIKIAECMAKIVIYMSAGNLLGLKKELQLLIKVVDAVRSGNYYEKDIKDIQSYPLYLDEDFWDYQTGQNGEAIAIENHSNAIDILRKNFKGWEKVYRSYEIIWKIRMSFYLADSINESNKSDKYEKEAMELAELASTFEDYMNVVEYLNQFMNLYKGYWDTEKILRHFRITDDYILEATTLMDADKSKIKRLEKSVNKLEVLKKKFKNKYAELKDLKISI